MYVRSDDDSDKRNSITRVPGKGRAAQQKSRTDGGRRPARDERSTSRDRKHETSRRGASCLPRAVRWKRPEKARSWWY